MPRFIVKAWFLDYAQAHVQAWRRCKVENDSIVRITNGKLTSLVS